MAGKDEERKETYCFNELSWADDTSCSGCGQKNHHILLLDHRMERGRKGGCEDGRLKWSE